MFDSRFESQADLVVRCLPALAKYDCFALKGGTAINMFVRDLPRVSVDIDLTYLPLLPRDESLQEIGSTLLQLKAAIEGSVSGSEVSERRIAGYVVKLSVAAEGAEVKIEPNLVIRGCLGVPVLRELSPSAQKRFRASARIATLPDADLYGGKICAALDRQHPRDLFDVLLLLEKEGVTSSIRRTFVVYLVSHARPMHELLRPGLIDITDSFERQFRGMSVNPVTLGALLDARQRLIDILASSLDDAERAFLLSMSSGEPDWNVLGFEGLEKMPALQWKLLNIRKMDAQKRDEQFRVLRRILEQ